MAIKIKYKKISKSKGRNFCDELWSLLVKIRDGKVCCICKATEYNQSHHLLSRRILSTRWDVKNGITVCPNCHEYSLTLSFHTSPWATETWVKENRPEQYAEWVKNRENFTVGDEVDYEQKYLELEEQHKQMTGAYYKIERLAQYLLAKNIDLIKTRIKENKKTTEIIQELNFPKLSEKTLKDFITANKKYFET